MATTHKIFEDFYEDAFVLIALHSSLEDYAMVYALNRCLKSNLKRTREDLDLSQQISFPVFEWRDVIHDRYWTLLNNNCIKEDDTSIEQGLFGEELTYTNHKLVPEYKDVDYFLKVEQDEDNFEEQVVKLILTLPNVVTAYAIDADQLKSKSNLIF